MVNVSQELKEIFQNIGINQEKIDFLYKETRKFGKTELGDIFQIGVDGEDWNFLDNIAWLLWKESKLPIEVRIKVGFEFFELFPLYYSGLTPFYEAIRDGEIPEKQLRQLIFEKLAHYLSSEDYCLYYNTEYVLWVEYFEHGGDIAQEAWDYIINSSNLSPKGKIRLLRISGPAPIMQKGKLYYELLVDEKHHRDIFDALVYSLYDVYGLYDLAVVKDVFNQLKNIDTNSKNYGLFQAKMTELKPLKKKSFWQKLRNGAL